MPQPVQVSQIADELASMFAAAQTDIEQQLASFPSARRAQKLRELQRTVNRLLDQIERDMRAWIETQLPEAYALGAADAAAVLGESFSWTQPHVEALNALALTTWDDLLSATRFVRRDVKVWIRTEARQQATLSLVEGRTARQAGAALADAAGNDLGIFTVTYRNGAKHRLADWADSAIRTVTADAYNQGTLNQLDQLGVGFVEVLDGDCGWTSHDDPDRANGSIRTVRDAAARTLSHPRCRRSFLPRVGLTASSARAATSIRNPQSVADQMAISQSARTPRAARTTRQPRASRSTR